VCVEGGHKKYRHPTGWLISQRGGGVTGQPARRARTVSVTPEQRSCRMTCSGARRVSGCRTLGVRQGVRRRGLSWSFVRTSNLSRERRGPCLRGGKRGSNLFDPGEARPQDLRGIEDVRAPEVVGLDAAHVVCPSWVRGEGRSATIVRR